MYKKSVFIFRRDLRLDDNKGINAALRSSKIVIPCFIFDPRQISDTNTYRSDNALQFMLESLQDLHEQLKKIKAKLYCFHGNPEKIITALCKKEKIDAIFVCKDYTPFSLQRDASLQKIARHYNVDFHSIADALLQEPEAVTTTQGDPYTIFTPFYKRSRTLPVASPEKLAGKHFYTQALPGSKQCSIKSTYNKRCAVQGGSTNAKKILRTLAKFKNYAQQRDMLEYTTTRLSAHNKFGTVSIRTVFHTIIEKLGNNHPLVRQLYWRDFFYSVAYFSPFVFGQPYKKKFENLAWNTDKKMFKRWCTGTTGFPLVDAGMRELTATGFMHNRARLITGSFLVKDLHINWLWGERYFAQQLVDYDPCVNNGNWQWVASTGCDAQPYFRIFNPWLQQKKFDPHCTYIKKWIPELKNIPNTTIHAWYKQETPLKNYPLPMVDHATEGTLAKKLYKKVVT